MKYSKLLLLAAMGVLAINHRAALAKPVGNAFTYQGRLFYAGDPAEGFYDFQFRLFDDEERGTQVGLPLKHGHVNVVGGYFTVMLDFGEGVFDGQSRWLEISVVASDSAGKMTVLSPRRAIAPVPYAIHASNSDSAGGYVRTVVVGPADTEIDSGNKLIDAINSIPDPNDNKRYLVKIEPGIYDLGDGSLQMREFVDIEGSGQDATVITSAAFDSWDKGTILASDNAELRNLTVRNRGGHLYAICISISSVSPVISNVTCTLGAEAVAFDQTHLISVGNECYPYLENVTVDLNVMYTGGDTYGLYCFDGAQPTLYRCRIFMFSEDRDLIYGVFNRGAAPVLEYTNIVTKNKSTSVGLHCEGLSPGIPVILRHCDITSDNVALSTQSYWDIDTTGTTLSGKLAEGSAFSGVSGAMQYFRLDSHWPSPNLVGGYPPYLVEEDGQIYVGNHVTSNLYGTPDVYGATISGGGGLSPNENHIVTAHFGTIAGGFNNQAGFVYGAPANWPYATVSGGANNTAGGRASVVPGGENNEASGNYSFAAGINAKAQHDGAFVWTGAGPGLASTAEGQFLANAVGGVGFNDVPPAGGFHVVAGSSTRLLAGTTMQLEAGGDISINCGSNSRRDVSLNETITVGGSSSQTVAVNRTIQVGKSADYDIGENLTMQIGKTVDIDAGDSVLIDTGKSHAEMNKDGNITLSGSDILLRGSASLFGRPNGTIAIQGDQIALAPAAKGAALDLKLSMAPPVSGKTLVIDTEGRVGVAVSSRRYKTDVQELDTEADAVLGLEPVRFKYKESGREDVGLIAEQVAEHVSDLVIYDKQGRPDAVKYDRLGVYLLEVVKQLKTENEQLKDRIDQLEKSLKK